MTTKRLGGRNGFGRGLMGVAALGTLAAGALLSGCIAYTTYEPSEDHAIRMRGSNHRVLKASMAEALRWTIKRFPPTMPREAARRGVLTGYDPPQKVAVGLPRGLSRGQYLEVIEAIGPVAQPLSGEAAGLPTYIVGRIEVRVGEVDIDVHRPLPAGDDAAGTHQLMEISLEGALGQWRVIDHQVYAPGVVALPEPGRLPPAPGEGAAPRDALASPEPGRAEDTAESDTGEAAADTPEADQSGDTGSSDGGQPAEADSTDEDGSSEGSDQDGADETEGSESDAPEDGASDSGAGMQNAAGSPSGAADEDQP